MARANAETSQRMDEILSHLKVIEDIIEAELSGCASGGVSFKTATFTGTFRTDGKRTISWQRENVKRKVA